MVEDKIRQIKLGRLHPSALFVHDMLCKLVAYKIKEFPYMYYCVLDNIIMVEYNSESNTLRINFNDFWCKMDKFYEHYTYNDIDYMSYSPGGELYGFAQDDYELIIKEEEKRMEQECDNDDHKLKMINYIFNNYPNSNLGFSYDNPMYISKFYCDVDIENSSKSFRKLYKDPTLFEKIKKYFKNDKG